MQVIPAINADNREVAEKQIKIAARFSDWVHLDVVDGVFSPHVTWGSPEDLKSLSVKLNFEVHLMVANPEGVIDAWLRTGLIKRVIVHLEAMTDSVYILEKCRKYGVDAMLAINPNTEVERLLAHKDDFRFLQILAVTPGWAGQKFNESAIRKIKFIRQNATNAIIEVDGGINPDTAKLSKEAGANIVVSASYIFGSKDPQRAFNELAAI